MRVTVLRLLAGASTASAVILLGGCSTQSEPPPPAPVPSTPASSSAPSYRTLTPEPTPTPTPRLPDLKGDSRNAIAFAPLDDPDRVKVYGDVDTANAWSTSKVLVAAAFVQEVAGGDPRALDPYEKELIRRSLTASDMDALLEMRGRIPGGSGAPMTSILRSIGDDDTTAPDSSEGSMYWSLRNQVRFMAAMANGQVVNERTSAFLLNTMRPIAAHSWGLGQVGARNFKGGWLEPYTETRQMGILDGYAVAIITTAGAAVVQTDGDSAHVKAMNRLARTLKKYLAADSLR